MVLRGELFAQPPVLVDVGHPVSFDVESHAQVFGAQHVVEVGNGREVLSCQAPVQGVEPPYAVVLVLHVGLHEADVGRQVFKESPGVASAEHCYAHVGVGLGQRVDHGHGHGHVAER